MFAKQQIEGEITQADDRLISCSTDYLPGLCLIQHKILRTLTPKSWQPRSRPLQTLSTTFLGEQFCFSSPLHLTPSTSQFARRCGQYRVSQYNTPLLALSSQNS